MAAPLPLQPEVPYLPTCSRLSIQDFWDVSGWGRGEKAGVVCNIGCRGSCPDVWPPCMQLLMPRRGLSAAAGMDEPRRAV